GAARGGAERAGGRLPLAGPGGRDRRRARRPDPRGPDRAERSRSLPGRRQPAQGRGAERDPDRGAPAPSRGGRRLMKLFSHDTKIDALKQVPLFEGLSKKELSRVAQGTEDLELAADTVLCREGGLAREFFVLVEGNVEVTQGGKHVATLGAGDFLGE